MILHYSSVKFRTGSVDTHGRAADQEKRLRVPLRTAPFLLGACFVMRICMATDTLTKSDSRPAMERFLTGRTSG